MFSLPDKAITALDRLTNGGHRAYVVGGCVRDMLLDIAPHDWDVCTSATPEAVKVCFPGFKLIETGLKHGTVTVLVAGDPIEVTTFRTEGTYTDHRRPDRVVFVDSLAEDLSRRDFTVNAMAYHPSEGLIDLFGGEADLREGVIRCVGDPDARFQEDGLRILRALRFAARFRFRIDESTACALRRNAPLLAGISAERVYAELKGILSGAGAGAMLSGFPKVFSSALSQLMCEDEAQQARAARAVDACAGDGVIRLAALFACLRADFAKAYENAESGMRALKADNAARDTVLTVLSHIGDPLPDTRPSARRMIAGVGEKYIDAYLCVREALSLAKDESAAPVARARALARAAMEEGDCLSPAQMALRGADLKTLGLAHGKAIGDMLNALFDEVIDGATPNTREALIARAKQMRQNLP